MSRTGKIAKLPPNLQEELNYQLERGVPGRILVAWLNAHPVVQAVLHEFFEGALVNEQNLSAWRRGGFADWQSRREFFDHVREVAADSGDFEKVAANMARHAARVLAAHYAIAINETPVPSRSHSNSPSASPYAPLAARLKPLATITRTVTALCRSDHDAARLQMQQAAFALAPKNHTTTRETHCDSAPAEPEAQSKSSQIKVQKSSSNPPAIRSQKPATRRSLDPFETPSFSHSPFPAPASQVA